MASRNVRTARRCVPSGPPEITPKRVTVSALRAGKPHVSSGRASPLYELRRRLRGRAQRALSQVSASHERRGGGRSRRATRLRAKAPRRHGRTGRDVHCASARRNCKSRSRAEEAAGSSGRIARYAIFADARNADRGDQVVGRTGLGLSSARTPLARGPVLLVVEVGRITGARGAAARATKAVETSRRADRREGATSGGRRGCSA